MTQLAYLEMLDLAGEYTLARAMAGRCPIPTLYTSQGYLTRAMASAGGPAKDPPYKLPAMDGGFYLTAGPGALVAKLTVHAADHQPIATVDYPG